MWPVFADVCIYAAIRTFVMVTSVTVGNACWNYSTVITFKLSQVGNFFGWLCYIPYADVDNISSQLGGQIIPHNVLEIYYIHSTVWESARLRQMAAG